MYRLEDRRGVADRSRDDQLLREAGEAIAEDGALRGPGAGRLQPHEPVGAGRDPDRATAVVCVGDGHDPAAVAAPEPPLEPPVEREVSQGLRLAPWASGSVVGRIPNSGVFVLPITTNPAARKRWARYVSIGGSKIRVFQRLVSEVKGLARVRGAEVLEQKGNALERAVGQRALRLGHPLLVELVDDCVDLGVDRCARSIAASTSSEGLLRHCGRAPLERLHRERQGVGHGVGTVVALRLIAGMRQ